MTIDKNGFFDVVTGIGIGPKIGQFISTPQGSRLPKMVVCVDDGTLGIHNILTHRRQPFFRARNRHHLSQRNFVIRTGRLERGTGLDGTLNPNQ